MWSLTLLTWKMKWTLSVHQHTVDEDGEAQEGQVALSFHGVPSDVGVPLRHQHEAALKPTPSQVCHHLKTPREGQKHRPKGWILTTLNAQSTGLCHGRFFKDYNLTAERVITRSHWNSEDSLRRIVFFFFVDANFLGMRLYVWIDCERLSECAAVSSEDGR